MNATTKMDTSVLNKFQDDLDWMFPLISSAQSRDAKRPYRLLPPSKWKFVVAVAVAQYSS